MPRPLDPEQLCGHCDPGQFDFKSTDDLAGLDQVIGQGRALEAVRFGVGVKREGYNLYVAGNPGLGKQTAVTQFLTQYAASEPTAPDWCYVNNFADPSKPVYLEFPTGHGSQFKTDMEQLVEELRSAVRTAFESDDYKARVRKIEEEYETREQNAFSRLHDDAQKQNVKIIQAPGEVTFAPTRDGEVLGPEDFRKLDEAEQKRIEAIVTVLQEQLETILHKEIPQWQKERRDKVRELNNDVTRNAVGHLIQLVKHKYQDLEAVVGHLDEVEKDVIANVDDFLAKGSGGGLNLFQGQGSDLRRYAVNLLVGNGEDGGAPVIYEDNPTYPALVGRVEHMAQLGALVTDFTLIKAGALHRANHGYLILDIRKVLSSPYAWDALKRVLYSNELRIESLGQMLSLVSTVSLEPIPIPLNAKVVLLGDRLLYYLLCEYDPEFVELFKVVADFESSMDRSCDNDQLYARLIATLAQKEKLRPFDPGAVARVIQHSMRLVDDNQKLSTHMRSVCDLMREADFWAGEEGHKIVTAADVRRALAEQVERVDRIRDRLYESIERGILMIDSRGEVVGQVNGLSVLQMGDFRFAIPVRITATTRLGEGEVVDIERETKMGGPVHSKGVFILSSFLASYYSRNQPLSLTASLTFEQSYSGVEGDSASLAELCALLSSLADVPVRQSLAITGSINQFGKVQPIGGVNEKVEGFFDICRQRGLTGDQGVLIPARNVEHLMLREDVVEAAAQGQFHIYAIDTVNEALELLTGMPAGEPDVQGRFPPDLLNRRVQARLEELAQLRREFSAAAHGKPASDK